MPSSNRESQGPARPAKEATGTLQSAVAKRWCSAGEADEIHFQLTICSAYNRRIGTEAYPKSRNMIFNLAFNLIFNRENINTNT